MLWSFYLSPRAPRPLAFVQSTDTWLLMCLSLLAVWQLEPRRGQLQESALQEAKSRNAQARQGVTPVILYCLEQLQSPPGLKGIRNPALDGEGAESHYKSTWDRGHQCSHCGKAVSTVPVSEGPEDSL